MYLFYRHNVKLSQLEESLRSLVIKLSASDSLLKPLPVKECTFRILLQVAFDDRSLFHNIKVH